MGNTGIKVEFFYRSILNLKNLFYHFDFPNIFESLKINWNSLFQINFNAPATPQAPSALPFSPKPERPLASLLTEPICSQNSHRVPNYLTSRNSLKHLLHLIFSAVATDSLLRTFRLKTKKPGYLDGKDGEEKWPTWDELFAGIFLVAMHGEHHVPVFHLPHQCPRTGGLLGQIDKNSFQVYLKHLPTFQEQGAEDLSVAYPT